MAEVSFGEWLKRRRGAEGWTQGQLAQQIHCSTSALRKFESEERHPSTEVVEQLTQIFKISPDERNSFLRFARGDWQAFVDGNGKKTSWRAAKAEQQSNLPSSISSFIGREKEQDEVIHLIKKNRLVTLAGAGGIGKTRLAIEVGQQLLPEYPDASGSWRSIHFLTLCMYHKQLPRYSIFEKVMTALSWKRSRMFCAGESCC